MKRENSTNGDDDSQNGDGQQSQNQNQQRNSGGGGGGGGGGGDRRSGGGNKRFRGNDESIRLLIPSRIAGAIIGKGGQHINRLRSEYKATINVEDCQGPERTVHVSAEFDNAISIVDEMIKNFDEKDDEYDIRMLIHQSLAGCVIGKGGSKIKEIRDKIGCRILKVFSNLCPQSSDRVVQCVGKSQQCIDAMREILELVKEVPIKGPVQNYDPINYDDMFADKYGGFGDSGGGRNGGYRGGDRYDRRGGDDRFDRRGGGGRNDRRDGGGRNMRDFIDPWAPNQGPGNNFGGNNGFGSGGGGSGGGGGGFGGNNMGGGGGFGGNNNMGGGGGGGGGFGNNMGGGGGGGGGGFGGNNMGGGGGGGGSNNMPSLGNFGGGNMGNNMGNFGNSGGNSGGGGNDGNFGPPNEDGKNTTQVTIPKDLAGAIIGKAGGRIRRIRMESNAFITIDEPLPGSTDRIITITGSPKQIQMAQYLLQQSVHEHRRQF